MTMTVQVSRGWEFQNISEMSEKFKIVSITNFMFELYTVKKKTVRIHHAEHGSCHRSIMAVEDCVLCIWRLTISIAECDEDEWGLVCSRLR